MNEIAAIACVLLLQHCTYVHAAPPIESCPHDSVQIDDTCKCDPKLCTKPPCQFELKIAVNGTDTPGNCCTIYSCEGCHNDSRIEGKCPCATGAILNSKGECKCADPYKNLINNECICNSDLCELPQICGPNYVSVTVHDECCSRNKCIKCPDDSFATSNNDETVEDKCVCYPCKDKDCSPNQKVVIMQRGNGFPGTCCDMYTCDNSSVCAVDGLVYQDGEVWDTPDSQRCECRKGISFCEQTNEESFLSCHKEGSVYKHNESWMLDSCTNCTCVNGETKCIAHMCELSEGHLKKPQCQPLNCSKICPDGYKLNKRGCKICKCNYSYKYDDILQKYSITKDQLKDILDGYFNRNRTQSDIVSTTTVATTNISDEFQFSTPINESDCFSPVKAIIWLAIGFSICLAVAIIILAIRCFQQRNKGSYDTNPAKEALVIKECSNNNYMLNSVK